MIRDGHKRKVTAAGVVGGAKPLSPGSLRLEEARRSRIALPTTRFVLPGAVQAESTGTDFDYILAGLFYAREALSRVSFCACTLPRDGQQDHLVVTAARRARHQAATAAPAFNRAFCQSTAQRLEPWAFDNRCANLLHAIWSGADHAVLAAEKAVAALDSLRRQTVIHASPLARSLEQHSRDAALAVDGFIDSVRHGITMIRNEFEARCAFAPMHPAASAVAAKALHGVSITAARVIFAARQLAALQADASHQLVQKGNLPHHNS